MNRLLYYGGKVTCPICGASLRKFLPYGRPNPLLERMQVAGGGYRPHALCPVCGSIDRERLLYLFLHRKTSIFTQPARLLHVAPEPPLEPILRACPSLQYVTADKFSGTVMVRMDITSIPFPDISFDAIICNHVLEYVEDEAAALKECWRVLKPGGWAIVQEQIAQRLDATYENPVAMTPSQRREEYGDSEHRRLYGRDYAERMQAGGFNVSVFDWKTEPVNFGLPGNRFGLLEKESVYLLRKPGSC